MSFLGSVNCVILHHYSYDPRGLDVLLGEVVVMNARTELYMKFLENRIKVCLSVSFSHSFLAFSFRLFFSFVSPFFLFELSLKITWKLNSLQ